MQGTIRSMTIAVVVLFVITVIIQSLSGNAADATFSTAIATTPQPTNVQVTRVPVVNPEIVVASQKLSPGGMIVVAKVIAKTPGWISIHIDTNGNPDTSNVGYVAVKKGQSFNVSVPIRTEKLTRRLWALLHVDAGKSGVFEYPGKDSLARTEGGAVVRVSFELTP